MLLTPKKKKKGCMKFFWCLCFYGIGPFSQVLSHIITVIVDGHMHMNLLEHVKPNTPHVKWRTSSKVELLIFTFFPSPQRLCLLSGLQMATAVFLLLRLFPRSITILTNEFLRP